MSLSSSRSSRSTNTNKSCRSRFRCPFISRTTPRHQRQQQMRGSIDPPPSSSGRATCRPLGQRRTPASLRARPPLGRTAMARAVTKRRGTTSRPSSSRAGRHETPRALILRPDVRPARELDHRAPPNASRPSERNAAVATITCAPPPCARPPESAGGDAETPLDVFPVGMTLHASDGANERARHECAPAHELRALGTSPDPPLRALLIAPPLDAVILAPRPLASAPQAPDDDDLS